MSLHISVLASGSKGNATLVESPGARFLIDCGLSHNQVALRLAAHGCKPESLDAVVITHLHADHMTRGAKTLCLRQEVPLFIHEDNEPFLLERFERLAGPNGRRWIRRFRFEPLTLGDCTLTPFAIPHDMPANTCGLRVESRASGGISRFAYATDLGHFPSSVLHAFEGCGAIMLEFNHDIQMLRRSARPDRIKERIHSDRGHLSNAQAAQALRQILSNGGASIESVLIAHMSAECNTDEHVIHELLTAIGPSILEDVSFVFARQDAATPTVTAAATHYAC